MSNDNAVGILRSLFEYAKAHADEGGEDWQLAVEAFCDTVGAACGSRVDSSDALAGASGTEAAFEAIASARPGELDLRPGSALPGGRFSKMFCDRYEMLLRLSACEEYDHMDDLAEALMEDTIGFLDGVSDQFAAFDSTADFFGVDPEYLFGLRSIADGRPALTAIVFDLGSSDHRASLRVSLPMEPEKLEDILSRNGMRLEHTCVADTLLSSATIDGICAMRPVDDVNALAAALAACDDARIESALSFAQAYSPSYKTAGYNRAHLAANILANPESLKCQIMPSDIDVPAWGAREFVRSYAPDVAQMLEGGSLSPFFDYWGFAHDLAKEKGISFAISGISRSDRWLMVCEGEHNPNGKMLSSDELFEHFWRRSSTQSEQIAVIPGKNDDAEDRAAAATELAAIMAQPAQAGPKLKQ